MRLRLRYWALLAVFSVILWWGLANQKQAISSAETTQILHVVNRLSFGATPGQIEQIKAQGTEAYIQQQLNPEFISESAELTRHLAGLEFMNTRPTELHQRYAPGAQARKKGVKTLSPEEKRKLQQQRKQVEQQAIEARLARAIASERQLQEVMVDFWFNHFNVYSNKRLIELWVGDYEEEIRKHALGHFRDLLAVTAHHPAMLIYLDNELNTDPNSPGAGGRFKGLNENYARELMELHTLGVDGGYTQADVIALARILTGWGVNFDGSKGDENGFLFFKQRHDFGDKVFLGTTIKGSGIKEGEQALDILANHPATARFISYKLAQYFVADEPPLSLIDTLAQRFINTDGDIQAVLDTLFHSQEFNDPQYYGNKFKTPYQYLLSVVRATAIDDPNYKRMQGMLQQLAMPVYGCLTPNGYKNTQSAWLNPEGMLRRVSIATAISRGALTQKRSVDEELVKASLNDYLSAETKQVIKNKPPKLQAALMLGSPEMMYQ